MKSRILIFSVALVMVFKLGSAFTLSGPSVRPSDIKGSWIGFDQNCLDFYRLTFKAGGKGLCVVLYFDDDFGVYHIKNWVLKNETLEPKLVPGTSDSEQSLGSQTNSLTLQLVPCTTNAEPMTMEVNYVHQREIRLIAKGVQRNWSRKVLLHREDDILKRAKRSEKIERKMKF